MVRNTLRVAESIEQVQVYCIPVAAQVDGLTVQYAVGHTAVRCKWLFSGGLIGFY
ncbi:hypothetical protein [Sulfoacidibacillus thermotolerans]|uniref:hypothetical protein n=1 Tax=Sulfoacidibacillus thermotolerans TaxID=1765684 RepID=UPI001C637AF6|nr:hypothetical protein [Sulfoacidibacillus thermotolerans]